MFGLDLRLGRPSGTQLQNIAENERRVDVAPNKGLLERLKLAGELMTEMDKILAEIPRGFLHEVQCEYRGIRPRANRRDIYRQWLSPKHVLVSIEVP